VPDVVLLASPRGWCAGVARALAMVEQELDGPAPVYLRHAIVHNASVVDGLADRGVRTVEDLHDVPEGATVVLSAHGVSPTVRAEAEARGLGVVDATCPLVSKVHAEVRRFASAGYTVVVIGHRDHVEVVGTMGEAPQHTVLVETVADVEALSPPDPERVAWVCQTTLSVTDAAEVVEAVRHRFPAAVGPRTEDICYATTNRQDAVVELARRSDLVLVLGSPTSSNSRRMVERARATGCRAELVENHHAIPDGLLVDVRVVGLTSGASAPERLVSEAVEWFGETWGARVEELTVRAEDVHFSVPPPRWRQA
jgi:4-hydroxy-3-methylbut-2-enyl diphosphate reductase